MSVVAALPDEVRQEVLLSRHSPQPSAAHLTKVTEKKKLQSLGGNGESSKEGK